MPATWEFVYCPNPKCYASRNSPVGESWRFCHKGPLNCSKCTRAFDVSSHVRKYVGQDGNGGKGKGGGQQQKQQQHPSQKESSSDKRSSTKQEEQGYTLEGTRKFLLETYKESADPEVLAMVNKLAPEKEPTQEELRSSIAERLQKATKRQAHEARKYESMHQASVNRAKELLEYNESVQRQREIATEAKDQLQELQLEHDRLHAELVPPNRGANLDAATGLSLDGIITRELAVRKLGDNVPAHIAAGLTDVVKGLLRSPDLVQLVRANQGGQQQQSQQMGVLSQQQQSAQASQQPSQQQSVVQQQGGGQQQQGWVYGTNFQSLQPLPLPPSLRPATSLIGAAAAAPTAPASSSQQPTAASATDADMAVVRVRPRDTSDDELGWGDDDDAITQENKRIMLAAKEDAVADEATLTKAANLAVNLVEQQAADDGGQAVAADGSHL